MWIDKLLHNPLKAGKYNCLVDVDGMGNLENAPNQIFNGIDWDHYTSCRQFIRYWEATQEEWLELSKIIDKEMDVYFESKMNDTDFEQL
jgi:hypothetical protein